MMILAAIICYLWVSEKLEKNPTESQIALLEIEGERPV
jgi:hypothetical protein